MRVEKRKRGEKQRGGGGQEDTERKLLCACYCMHMATYLAGVIEVNHCDSHATCQNDVQVCDCGIWNYHCRGEKQVSTIVGV